MITASQTVRIDRHELQDGIVALSVMDAAAAGQGELVFVLHGLGSRKERYLDLCLRLARSGFRACAVDARLHGDRQSAESAALAGDRTGFPFMKAFGLTARGTAGDVTAMADYFGATQYGIVGHSMGGFIALLTTLDDKRVKAVVNVAGSLPTTLPKGVAALLPTGARELIASMDTVRRAAEFWPSALLVMHGELDETVPVGLANRLYAAASPAYAESPERLDLRIFPGVGHEFTVDEVEQTVEWFQRYLL